MHLVIDWMFVLKKVQFWSTMKKIDYKWPRSSRQKKIVVVKESKKSLSSYVLTWFS